MLTMETAVKEKQHAFKKLFQHVKEYVEARFDLALLNAQDRLGDIVSSLASVLIVILAGFFAFILINFGLALLIGKLIHNRPAGFLILGGVYVIVGALIWFNKTKWIKRPVTDSLLSKINIHEEGY
jgi:hypothetical protein